MTPTKSTSQYWSRNGQIIDDPTVNVTFEELLFMTPEEFEKWVDHLRARVLEVWDEYGIPPLSGLDESEMCEEFRKMSGTPGKTISLYKPKSGSTKPYIDQLDGQANVIINDGYMGSCVNQFFPTMMKAKINYQTKVTDKGCFSGYAVYDLFANDKFRNRMQKGCRRHFRRDSFYRYAISILINSTLGLVPAETGKEWVQLFKRDFVRFADYGYWLNRVEPPEEGETGSGYTEVDASNFLWLSKAEIIELADLGIVGRQNLTNLLQINYEMDVIHGIDASVENTLVSIDKSLKDDEQYHIRFYKKSTRIFPLGFTAFKIGYIQVAVNFPPMISKYIYEKYTDKCKGQKVINVYDPSAGWGGRIAGAMTVQEDRHINYIGTDPNTDNFIDELGITRYEYLANFINTSLASGWGYEPHTYDVYQLGSEVIGKDKKFKKYKGKLDLVFTSPPYFNREGYSEDDTQSLKKFPQYDAWREGFLKPTLTTAYTFLKPDRYLLWNIADIKTAEGYYPLEQDSKDILKKLGAEFVGVEKMVLANMPGANRVGDDGKPTCKNYCQVNNKWHKTELIFVFRKPK
jgi:hypothetical protein